jgi:hypothetical protein
VHLVSRLWVFDVCVVPIEVCGIIIEHVTVGCTLGNITQTLLFQTTKRLLKTQSLLSSKLELAVYDDGVMSVTSIVVRDATGLAKAFVNLNMISSDRRGRHELYGIVKSQDVEWSEWWIPRAYRLVKGRATWKSHYCKYAIINFIISHREAHEPPDTLRGS